ncbi:CotH kinase family protein [Mycolicibacterium sp.]|uniref:CotH kinase family protein n=1 Tax=Mycolicibacterium sp. TaxID=2320850 RepID=UPI001A32A32A|nr:CotH kinase family protein [Mycolicibacterium sp.]MBJ7337894.1 CotH kinase family protein [Mycolicibacterium sp.]
MTVRQQEALDSLYALDNLLTIKIVLPQADWDALRTEAPKGGVCNFKWTGGARFTWARASAVEIWGTNFPARTTFTNVGVKKKSFCGSLDSEKPCLHLDFGRFTDVNAAAAEDLIGSRYLTLNNSIQDRSYIRQPLGYRLLAMAGLPHSRCNYARVFVNGTLIGDGFVGVNGPGIYVNAEPVMERYLERNFGNAGGNLYEFEHHDDFVIERVDFTSVEPPSAFENKADLTLATRRIADDELTGAAEVLDLDQFIKVYAMEFYLKHWDGYSGNTNNTYVYNDVAAVEAPGVANIRFKMIPWGIDQTLQPDRLFTLARGGLIARLVRDDATRREQLLDQVATFRETVFGRDIQQTVLKQLIDQMEAMLLGFGVPGVAVEITAVRRELRLAGSAGYLCAGLPVGNAVHLLDGFTGACLRASNTEAVPPGTANPTNFEVYHLALRGGDDAANLWSCDDLGSGKSFTSKAFPRVLHASRQVTAQGHRYLYTCAPGNLDRAEEFSVVPVDSPDEFTFTGYFKLASVRTGERATYGMDLTPAGSARVHQEPEGSSLYFY